MRFVAVVGLALGCGRVSFDLRDDARSDTAIADSNDAMLDASLCMVDPFDTLSSTAYIEIGGGGTSSVVNGQLKSLTPGTPGTDAAITTTPNRSFVGISVAIEVIQAGMYTESSTGPGLHGASESLHFFIRQGMLELTAGIAGTVAMAPYDPTAHHWLRFRESGGTVFGEVSDGVGWDAFGQFDYDVSDATYDVGIDPGSGAPGTDIALFDNLSICP